MLIVCYYPSLYWQASERCSSKLTPRLEIISLTTGPLHYQHTVSFTWELHIKVPQVSTWLYFSSEFNQSTRKRTKPLLSTSRRIQNCCGYSFPCMHPSAEISTLSSLRRTLLGFSEACKKWQALAFLPGIKPLTSSFSACPKVFSCCSGDNQCWSNCHQ